MPDDVPAVIRWLLNLQAKVQFHIHEHVMPHYPETRGCAETRAKALLISCLTPYQKEQWETLGSFTAIGERTGVKYHIGRYGLGSVWSSLGNRFCVRCQDNNLPMADHYLAIKLMIETDEKTFLNTAVMLR